jgi:hypothetical protein
MKGHGNFLIHESNAFVFLMLFVGTWVHTRIAYLES